MSAASFRSHWFGRFLQESFQVNAIEKSVTISRVPVHRYGTRGRPFAERVLGNAKDLRSLGGFHIVRQLDHGLPLFLNGTL